MQEKTIAIVNALHGNAPAIMGVYMAKELGRATGKEFDIVLPNLYPGRQENILTERFGVDENVFVDSELGRIVHQVMFENQNYPGHLDDMLEKHADTKAQATAHVHGKFEATSLSGKRKQFEGNDIAIELNLGSQTGFGITPQAYVFCSLGSDIIAATVQEKGLGFNTDKLKRVQEILKKEESRYETTFICEPNTFSATNYKPSYAGVMETAPLMRRTSHDETKIVRGVYVMLSGTGSAAKSLVREAKELGLQVYISPWADKNLAAGATVANPSVISHPNILAVLHRGGLGTAWEALLNGKPQLLLPYQKNDDPETYFDIQTYQNLGLGVILNGEAHALDRALALKPRIEAYRNSLLQKFGTLDGFEYAAPIIAAKAGFQAQYL